MVAQKYIFAAVVLAASVIFLPGCTEKGEEEAFMKAEKSLSEGNYPEALSGYRRFVENYPESRLAPQGQYRIGQIYRRHTGDVKMAMDAYAMLFYLYPDAPQVYLAREDMAEVYSSIDEPRKSIAQYAYLIENGPGENRDRYRYRMALEYVKLNDFRQARIELEELLEDAPSTALAPDAHYNIALTYHLEGNLEEALEAYERVISSFPGHPLYKKEARLGKAAALEESGRINEAFLLLSELEREYPLSTAVRIKKESVHKRLKGD